MKVFVLVVDSCGEGIHVEVFSTKEKALEVLRNTFSEEMREYEKRSGLECEHSLEEMLDELCVNGLVSPDFTADTYFLNESSVQE